jgi:hypothetical protein
VAVLQGEPADIGQWVDAAPFRALLRHWMAVGAMTSDEIAALAGIPARLADRLLNGRNGRALQRICPITAARLLLVSECRIRAARPHRRQIAA